MRVILGVIGRWDVEHEGELEQPGAARRYAIGR